LHGDLEEEIYMRQPPGYISPEYPDKVCHLLRSLYGLKQAQHVYNQKWNKSLDSAGYKQGGADPCVRTLTRQGLRAISQTSKKSVPAAVMGTYVDDSLIAGTTESVKAVKNDIKMAFPIKDLGPAQTIVGIEIRRDRKSKLIHLSQKKHVEELLARCNMQECNPVSTPLAPGTQLNMAMCPASNEEKEEMMKAPYANVVGSLLYLATGTRPDISHAVGVVSRFMKNPGREHWMAVKRILRYLKGTATLGIQFGGPKATLIVNGYVDADWAGDVESRRSTTGYVFMLAGGPVSWRSRRQQTVALSTMEAEYMALCDATTAAVWLGRLMMDLTGDEESAKPIVMHEDNEGCRAFAKNPPFMGAPSISISSIISCAKRRRPAKSRSCNVQARR
jgi:Reverse transcriptase (RNA-dependent DNA polymerase)